MITTRSPRVLAILAAAAVAATACASSTPDTQEPAAATVSAPTVPATPLSPQLDHMHGLHQIADGTLVAGTHTGLFAITVDGATSRIGQLDDDLMGLAGVHGTDTLYSSGHPGPTSQSPNPLGLIASTDAGSDWTAMSLVGEVDFHALAATEDLLVGFDGTTGLRVSEDQGRTWTAGAALAAASLAITDTGVWAATPQGLVHSTDNARTFAAVPDSPALALLAAGADGSLWGVDTDGAAWRSVQGQAWEKHSHIGDAAALTAVDYDTAYAATTESLYTLG